MKPVGLALDDIPPLRVPLRFYLTAPLFGAVIGIWWILEGDLALTSRWAGGTLAATHLLTLGFMAMVMIGSLFQVVPVLGGGSIPMALGIAPVVHLALSGGTICLVAGLAWSSPALLGLALAGLGTAFGVFVPLLAFRVLARSRGGDAMFTLRLAVLSLLLTILLGAWMALGIAWPVFEISHRSWTDVHAGFGFAGWVMLLIMGVSYQVVPMFHVTPPFDSRLVRGAGLAVFGGLLVIGVSDHLVATISGTSLITLAGLTYAFTTCRLLARRRRRRAEPAVRAWQTAMVFLALSLLLGWKIACLPAVRIPGVEAHRESLLLGALFGLGFGTTVILGMLGKIVPFLSFTHLQKRSLKNPSAIPLLPTMDEIIPVRAARWQVRLHLATCAMVTLAMILPEVTRTTGVFVLADFAMCEQNLLAAALRYRRSWEAVSAIEAEPR